MNPDRYYDADLRRLVFVGNQADADYWDAHWRGGDVRRQLLAQRNRLVERVSQRYLPPGATVLEGGCGCGQNVLRLTDLGYRCVGLDYAAATVARIRQALPELDVRLGDVRALPFADRSFDGYWSLGVIEHFYDGYAAIRDEMARVIKPSGYLFLTVPSMSPLRRLKARLRCFPIWRSDAAPLAGFYQFALAPDAVAADFAGHGFRLIERRGIDGVKGLKDEVAALRPFLQALYDGRSRPTKALRRALDLVCAPFTHHMTLFVFVRNSDGQVAAA